MLLRPLWIVSSFYEVLCFRSFSWQRLWSVGHQRLVGSSVSGWIDAPSMKRKCVVSCFVCRIMVGARTSHKEIFFRNQAWRCCLNLLLLLIALRQVLFMPHGVLWSPRLRVRSLPICVPLRIGWCCAVALLKTPVSAGIMVALLGVRQHQGQGWEYQTSLRRGALSTCQFLRLLLVLLGQAESVLLPTSGREKPPEVWWSRDGDFKCRVLQLVPGGDLW